MPAIGNIVPLLQTVEFIVDNPGLHDQEFYTILRECGTAHCVAGWIAHFAGYRQIAGDSDSGAFILPVDICERGVDYDGQIETKWAAFNVLRVPAPDTDDVYANLFNADLTVPDLLRATARYAEESGVDLAALSPRVAAILEEL